MQQRGIVMEYSNLKKRQEIQVSKIKKELIEFNSYQKP